MVAAPFQAGRPSLSILKRQCQLLFPIPGLRAHNLQRALLCTFLSCLCGGPGCVGHSQDTTFLSVAVVGGDGPGCAGHSQGTTFLSVAVVGDHKGPKSCPWGPLQRHPIACNVACTVKPACLHAVTAQFDSLAWYCAEVPCIGRSAAINSPTGLEKCSCLSGLWWLGSLAA